MVKRLLALAETPPRDAADALAAALAWSPLAAAHRIAGAAGGRAGWRAKGLGASRVVIRRVL